MSDDQQSTDTDPSREKWVSDYLITQPAESVEGLICALWDTLDATRDRADDARMDVEGLTLELEAMTSERDAQRDEKEDGQQTQIMWHERWREARSEIDDLRAEGMADRIDDAPTFAKVDPLGPPRNSSSSRWAEGADDE